MIHPTARIIAIIQARMTSSRLPAKVLLDIAGQPMLALVVGRARQAQTVNEVVVATTTDASDEPLVSYCQTKDFPCSRGSLHDVLERYYQTALACRAEVIVRITADCPLIDPDLIDLAVRYFLGQEGDLPPGRGTGRTFPWDFVANRLPPPWGRTYPIGLDVEVCSFEALSRARNEAQEKHQREHVMPFLYENSPIADSRRLYTYTPPDENIPGKPAFRALLVNHEVDYGSLRWTVDTPQDLEVVRHIFAHFAPRSDFSWLETLAYYQSNPALAQTNASVRHKNLYDVDERAH